MNTINGIPLQTIFTMAHLEVLGVTYAEFTKNPGEVLERVGQHDAVAIIQRGFSPLLPAQVRLRQQLTKQWEADGSWDSSANRPLPGHETRGRRGSQSATLAA